jgi:hypothetical protein
VQVPTQPVDDTGAFGYEVFAVVGQQPHLTGGLVQVCGRQVRLA